MHNKEEWNAGITHMTVREEDVHDRHPVRQGHVSAFPFTPSAVARESFASQLCLPAALTHGRFASSLCPCPCPCLLLKHFQAYFRAGLVAICLNPRSFSRDYPGCQLA